MPGAAYGFTQEVADAIAARQDLEDCDVGGIGGTLAGNALSLAAMRATLDKRSDQGSLRSHDSAGRKLDGGRADRPLQNSICPGMSRRLGCRAEYLFSPDRPRNGTEAHDAMDFELERFMHLFAMNRGIC